MSQAQSLSPSESAENSPVREVNVANSFKDDDFILEQKQTADVSAMSPEAEAPPKPISAYFTVICLCLMIAFGGFVFGWDTGTISGFVAQTDFKRRFGQQAADGSYYLSDVRTGLIVAIFNIGCAIGGLTLGRLGDMYGRRLGLMAVITVYVVGIVIQISSTTTWYQYFVGRIVSGLGVGGIAVLSPTLISETAPKHLRGTCVSFYQLMITLGIFLGYCTNYGTKTHTNSIQWRVPLGLCFAWALFMLVGMSMVPESPRFLVEKGRFEEARRSLARSNKVSMDDPIVTAEIENISAGVEAEKSAGNASWGELFPPRVRSCNVLSWAVGLEDSFQTSIILGIVNFASTFVALYVVDRFGRRKCLLWGSSTMAVCMVIFASVGVKSLYPNGKDQPSSTTAGNVMIVFTCLYIFCFATTWAPTAYVIVAETYPLRVKNRAMAIAVGFNWIWGFLIGFFTPFITTAINFYYGYVFMGCLVFSFFYVFFFVCETKGLTLEEVNEMYEEGVLPWKSAQWLPTTKRTSGYDVDAALHDDKPWYKRFA
ncbi:Major facilitator superfamily (MFS) profile [Nakaseomyces glabratus]